MATPSTSDEGLYIPVEVGAMDVDAMALCDLFLMVAAERYTLYLAKGNQFARSLLSDLRQRHVRVLYVRAADAADQAHQLLSRAVTSDRAALPADEQAARAYHALLFSVEMAFGSPRAEAIRALETVVSGVVAVAVERVEVLRWLMTLTRHDGYTYSHSLNVMVFGTALAVSMEANPEWVRRLALGLAVHDIGKSRVPPDVINEPGKLSPAQWVQMKRHPALGIEVLEEAGVPLDPVVTSVVIAHHERSDGRGYPKHLRGPDIPLAARICAVADVFDALTTDRSYRDALCTYDGLQVMVDEMGREFDPRLLECFIRLFQEPGAVRRHATRVARG